MGRFLAGQDLAGRRQPAQPGREVQRPAPIAALDGHGLAGVDPDPDGEGERRIGHRLVDEPVLQVDGGPDGLTGRAEHGQGLVATELDDPASAGLNALTSDRGELRCELGGGLVAPVLGEEGVAADVGDQEAPDAGRPIRSVVPPSGPALFRGWLIRPFPQCGPLPSVTAKYPVNGSLLPDAPA